MSLSQIKSIELQKDSFLLSKFQSVGVMKCFSYFLVIIVRRIIGSDKIWSDSLKHIKVSNSTWETGTWSGMIKRKWLHIKTHTQTQQMAWHISRYTLSRRNKEVWESTSLPPSSAFSKKSVCRFTQTHRMFLDWYLLCACLYTSTCFICLTQKTSWGHWYNVHFDPDIFSLI